MQMGVLQTWIKAQGIAIVMNHLWNAHQEQLEQLECLRSEDTPRRPV